MKQQEVIWWPVPWLGGYEVSNTGEVVDLKTHETLSQKYGKEGYFYVELYDYKHRKYVHRYVHVLVASIFLGQPMGGKVIHKDGNKMNNHVDNLMWEVD